MAEQLPASPEHQPRPPETTAEQQRRPEHQADHHEELRELADLLEVHKNVEQEAKPAEQITPTEQADHQPDSLLVKQELKQDKFWHTLNSARKKLSRPDKFLSNLVHQPVVDTLSNVGEKTVGRPSGLLGGGLFALVGSSTVLWAAKHYGFRYNFLLFFLLFIAGFLGGLLAEIVFKLIRVRRQS